MLAQNVVGLTSNRWADRYLPYAAGGAGATPVTNPLADKLAV